MKQSLKVRTTRQVQMKRSHIKFQQNVWNGLRDALKIEILVLGSLTCIQSWYNRAPLNVNKLLNKFLHTSQKQLLKFLLPMHYATWPTQKKKNTCYNLAVLHVRSTDI